MEKITIGMSVKYQLFISLWSLPQIHCHSSQTL